jgi:fucose permease
MTALYLTAVAIVVAIIRAHLKTWADSLNNKNNSGISRKSKHGFLFLAIKKEEHLNRALAYICYVIGILNYCEKGNSDFYVFYRWRNSFEGEPKE